MFIGEVMAVVHQAASPLLAAIVMDLCRIELPRP
jgi:hypothetical protein